MISNILTNLKSEDTKCKNINLCQHCMIKLKNTKILANIIIGRLNKLPK